MANRVLKSSASFIACLALFVAWSGSAEAERIDDRPNIIWVFCDDMGWADLGANGSVDDAKTPHLDALAARGVRFTSGTITAPQCSPSRAGLMTGRYQQRFGFGHIGLGPLPLSETTIADRLAEAGYATGMIGKWHLEPNAATPDFNRKRTGDPKRVPPSDEFLRYFPEQRGFTDVYKGEIQRYRRTYRLNGQDIPQDAGPIQTVDHPGYRLTTQTQAALGFITRHRERPFFLYLAYFAPHVPLEATPELLMRFPGPMAERRRHALAMNAAMDDGVGAIVKRLETLGLADNTMIVFLSDNGAPIKIDKFDRTLEWKGGAWDGSINDPLNGEKGTLLEGGIRVPFVLAWPKRIPAGQVADAPVSSLDLAATAVSMAGVEPAESLDGIDLIPHLADGEPMAERDLFWRFWAQSAVRRGDWKLLVLSSGERYLFNLAEDPGEKHNLASDHPDRVEELHRSLESWADEMIPAGLPSVGLNGQEDKFFEAFLGRPIQ
ncbi:MAG: sulfatase-like hydrolase/transferase [Planctomycetota bacterium]